jgi:hypothetical protein
MFETLPRPELVINYAPTLDLRIVLGDAQSLGDVSVPVYRFELNCSLRHAMRTLQYRDPRVFFELTAMQRFMEQLKGIQQGTTRQAALSDPGEMVAFRLESDPPKLHATLDIREYLPPSSFTLHESHEVDYDLFVNKLCIEVERFLNEVREIEPSPPEWTSP